jgi:hypothetical protein
MLIALVRALTGAWKKLNELPPPPTTPRAPVPIEQNAPLATAAAAFAGPLRYLIGRATPSDGADGEITEVGYDVTTPAKRGRSIKYANLFDEKNTGRYGPYLHRSDTAAQYNEGQIDPRGVGWGKNLHEQLTRAKAQGFEYVELDNPDAYCVADVVGAVEMAGTYQLKVIA